MVEFMVDLETMGIGNKAAITAIGVVAMDMSNLKLESAPDGEFYMPISLASSMEAGLECDASTILWWMGQSDEARKEMAGRTVSLYTALIELNYWMAKLVSAKKERVVWGNGASFDNVILANAYKAVHTDVPWTYSGDRCFRTMKSLVLGLEPPFDGEKHNALADARHQAEWLMSMMLEVRHGDCAL